MLDFAIDPSTHFWPIDSSARTPCAPDPSALSEKPSLQGSSPSQTPPAVRNCNVKLPTNSKISISKPWTARSKQTDCRMSGPCRQHEAEDRRELLQQCRNMHGTDYAQPCGNTENSDIFGDGEKFRRRASTPYALPCFAFTSPVAPIPEPFKQAPKVLASSSGLCVVVPCRAMMRCGVASRRLVLPCPVCSFFFFVRSAPTLLSSPSIHQLPQSAELTFVKR